MRVVERVRIAGGDWALDAPRHACACWSVPCRLGPNCFGPLFLQLCLSFGNRQPCLFGRIERPNASLPRTRRHVVDAPLELAAARLAHTARKAAAASLLLAGGPSAAVPAAVAAVMLAEGCIASLAIANFVAGSDFTAR